MILNKILPCIAKPNRTFLKKASGIFLASIVTASICGAVSSKMPSAISSVAQASVPLRGVVEGFYGTPWSAKKRLEMFSFMSQNGFNAYIYAPKDDPYHREKWREPYPDEEFSRLKILVDAAKANNLRFIFAVSPGLDINYTGEAGQKDREYMRQKFAALYDAGVRDFAVFFDDIKNRDGKNQALLISWLTENFTRQHSDVSPLITVPTEYFLHDMKDEQGVLKPYTRDFAANLPDDALVLSTGEEVVAPKLTEDNMTEVNAIYGKKTGVWHNYPVTDYMEGKLALGAIINLPGNTENMAAIFFNPMKNAELSKVALSTGAAYALDAAHYDPQQAQKKAVAELFSNNDDDNLPKAFLIFADHSQKLKNSWADTGHEDGAKMNADMTEFLTAYEKNSADADEEFEEKLTALKKDAQDMVWAAKYLKKNLPAKILAECSEQLTLFQSLGEADLTAAEILATKRAGKTDNDLARLFNKQTKEIRRLQKKAIISELPAREKLYELALLK